jgi:hypothetical protein
VDLSRFLSCECFSEIFLRYTSNIASLQKFFLWRKSVKISRALIKIKVLLKTQTVITRRQGFLGNASGCSV